MEKRVTRMAKLLCRLPPVYPAGLVETPAHGCFDVDRK
ncbi:hypothetical protein [Azospirillum doebereinerae]